MDADTATEIWNRAAMAGAGAASRPGDVALSAVLAFHGMVMSGGVGHAFDALPAHQIAAAADGYRYLGLPSVADVIASAPGVIDTDDDDAIEALDERYAEIVPLDATITDRFEQMLRADPDAFAPLD